MLLPGLSTSLCHGNYTHSTSQNANSFARWWERKFDDEGCFQNEYESTGTYSVDASLSPEDIPLFKSEADIKFLYLPRRKLVILQ